MSLRYKLTLAIAALLVFVMGVATVFQVYGIRAVYRHSLEDTRKALLQSQMRNMKDITLAVDSVFRFFETQAKEGKMTLEEAQTMARETVRVIRYDTENKELAVSGGNYFWIDQTDGINILHPITPQIEGKNRITARDANGMEHIRAIIQSGMKPGGDFTEFYYDKPGENTGKPKVGFSIEFTPWKWVIGTGFWTEDWNAIIDDNMETWLAEGNAYIEKMTLFSTVAFLSMLVIVLAVVFVCTKRFAKPILELAAVSRKMADGNLNVGVVGRGDRKDEIGVLEKSMNDMTENLSSLLRQLNDSSQDLFSASRTLSDMTEKSTRSARDITATARDISDQTEAQFKSVKDMTGAIEGIISGVENVASISDSLSEKSMETSAMAEKGNASLSGVLAQMDSIAGTTKQTADAIRTLGEKSKQISEIIGLINSISDQTNLLALNAAIEAARAGEYGRGFAVVAEEVRKLAEQSRQATEKISEQIAAIQEETERTVSLMDVGVSESAKGVDAVTQNATILKEIISNIEALNEEIHKVSSVMDNLSSSSASVRSSAESLDEICAKTSASAKNIVNDVDQQSSRLSEIENSTRRLSGIADGMQGQVARFSL
ncbi:MAG: methyl-accepting chemotaxis protein [Synergistaceae bacterium]|jgi:methyl-accepting chemotaxis protein|nr:methyl-accepting chemotaxis protein [Synergistaceae bacterium]